LAGHDVSGTEIAGMGVGGLLMEISTRPQPRETPAPMPEARVHAIVLAAGRSSRMGGPNKLLAAFDGEPLVRRIVAAASASKVTGITVVVGHQRARIAEALDSLRATIVENRDFAEGLSSSLKAGIANLAPMVSGALVVLGDMPGISTDDLDRLIAAFRRSGGKAIVRATHAGKRGNPVILPRHLFAAVAALEGDTGARHIVEAEGNDVIDVELGEAASVDVDTPEAMARAGGVLQG
jgi:molybdenum cofactor cytidylyltransferase